MEVVAGDGGAEDEAYVKKTVEVRGKPFIYCVKQGGRLGEARPLPIFGTMKTSAFSTNTQPRFASHQLLMVSWNLRT